MKGYRRCIGPCRSVFPARLRFSFPRTLERIVPGVHLAPQRRADRKRMAGRDAQRVSRRSHFASQHRLLLAMPLARVTPHRRAMRSRRAPVLKPRKLRCMPFASRHGVIDRRLRRLHAALRTGPFGQPPPHPHFADTAQHRPETHIAGRSRRTLHAGHPSLAHSACNAARVSPNGMDPFWDCRRKSVMAGCRAMARSPAGSLPALYSPICSSSSRS